MSIYVYIISCKFLSMGQQHSEFFSRFLMFADINSFRNIILFLFSQVCLEKRLIADLYVIIVKLRNITCSDEDILIFGMLMRSVI